MPTCAYGWLKHRWAMIAAPFATASASSTWCKVTASMCRGIVAAVGHCSNIEARDMPPCRWQLSMRRAALNDADLVRIKTVFLTQLMQPRLAPYLGSFNCQPSCRCCGHADTQTRLLQSPEHEGCPGVQDRALVSPTMAAPHSLACWGPGQSTRSAGCARAAYGSRGRPAAPCPRLQAVFHHPPPQAPMIQHRRLTWLARSAWCSA
jgi:hypothetical protein